MTKGDLDLKYKEAHDKLTTLYYRDKKIDQATFDLHHRFLTLWHQQQRLMNNWDIPSKADSDSGKQTTQQISAVELIKIDTAKLNWESLGINSKDFS
jgi:hypothetical protein